jgi:hypothetical protein
MRHFSAQSFGITTRLQLMGFSTMKLHPFIIIAALMTVLSFFAVHFRYKVYNKSDLNTAVFDRWTGTMTLCGQVGCSDQYQLENYAQQTRDQAAAENASVAEKLSNEYAFDLAGARKAGYSDAEVVDYLKATKRLPSSSR